MKKILIIIVCLAGMNIPNYAQYSKGKIALGGSFSISYEKTKTNTTSTSSNFEILPSAEYFITNNFSVGMDIGYQSQMSEYPYAPSSNTLKTVNSSFIAQPYVKKYLSLGEHLSFFGKAEVDVSFGKVTTTVASDTQTEKTFEVAAGVSPGLSFLLSKRTLIEATFGTIGFSTETDKPDSGTKTTITGLTFTVNPVAFGLGVKFFLN